MRNSKKRERENPCFMCGHYHDYAAGEPCSICGHAAVPAAVPDCPAASDSAFPSEILPGFLYLGSYDNASRSELLKAMGIKQIINVRSRAPAGTTRGRPNKAAGYEHH